MFTTQGMLLLLLLLGYALTHIGIILHAFQMEFDADIARSCVAITLVGLCIQLGGALLSLATIPLWCLLIR